MQTGETMQITDAAYAANVTKDPYHHNRLAIALRLLKSGGSLRGKTVFDFGCGEGTFMRMLSAEGADVSGSDPSKKLIDLAPGKAAVGSVETLEDLAPASQDVLIVLNVLGYVPPDQQLRFWRAAHKALKVGGLMLQGNANSRVAAGKTYTFMADPVLFPGVLAGHGFKEIGRDYHRYRIMPWTRILTGKRDEIDMHKQDRFPKFWRARRSTSYLSLSQKR